jgi:glycosyltransferase involved in cell wall biosynthesis
MQTTLSVIIITKNSATQIQTCLESVKFADEIIVLDSGSTDETVDICRRYTDKVFVTDWPGFGVQKNRAMLKASGQWILSLDADEHLTLKLQQSIQQVIAAETDINAYALHRRSSFCGTYIKYGDWSRDYCLRLFKAGKAKFEEVPVHERLLVSGKTAKIQGILLHDSYPDLASMLAKLNSYSSLGAKLLYEKGKRSSLSKALLRALWRFVRGYIFRLGCLDGKAGLLLALTTAEATFYRYAKLMYMTRKN